MHAHCYCEAHCPSPVKSVVIAVVYLLHCLLQLASERMALVLELIGGTGIITHQWHFGIDSSVALALELVSGCLRVMEFATG